MNASTSNMYGNMGSYRWLLYFPIRKPKDSRCPVFPKVDYLVSMVCIWKKNNKCHRG